MKGIFTLVLVRRWKITAQMISPQTSSPTVSAAAQEPCHRDGILGASSVEGVGMPRRGMLVQVDSQPEAVDMTRKSRSSCPAFRFRTGPGVRASGR
ncbi:hypothetical protein PL81_25620 [Streptomyces sp. RSD-27]|nr:hypothetical protein PL81_25620 [Streptomyces sp. RSD-27]